MRLLKLKRGSRVSGRSSGAVRPSVDRGVVLGSQPTFRYSIESLGNSVSCALIVFGLIPRSSYADPLSKALYGKGQKQIIRRTDPCYSWPARTL